MQQPAKELQSVRRIIKQLRDHIDRLKEENTELRDENTALRQELRQARQSSAPQQGAPPAQVLDDGEDDFTERLESLMDQDLSMLDDREVAQMLGLDSTDPNDTNNSGWGRMARDRELGGGNTESYTQGSSRQRTTQNQSGRRRAPQKPLPPRRAQSDDMGAYQRSDPRGPRLPESAYYGQGASPDVASQRGVTPQQSGNRPNLDIGYINEVDPGELDTLPYGLIVLDTDGNVLFYNETESKLAGYDREQVTGRNFFEDVAPCTRVKEFQGRFEDFVAGELGRVTFFDFAFHFEQETQNVVIGLSHGRRKGHINVMLVRQ